jgi:hypothetical protein
MNSHREGAEAHRLDDIDRPLTRQRARLPLAVLGLALLLSACSAEDMFTQGRVKEPCTAVYPTCHSGRTAGCYLDEDKYAEGQFPGAQRILVATNVLQQGIRIRIFFREMIYPGTEIMAQVYEPDCGDDTRDLREGIDVFEEAGDDRIIIFDLPADTPGDHLIELYSDCAADYLVTADPRG